jgi:hypothetical protein
LHPLQRSLRGFLQFLEDQQTPLLAAQRTKRRN